MASTKKEQILIKAVELFARNGYDNVSITDLQYALDIGRGTMYYYFKSKDDLFIAVMQRYFIDPKKEALNLPNTIDVPQMINAILQYLSFLEKTLMQMENKQLNTSSVVTLMYTAYNRFPELYKQASKLYTKELNLWKTALNNSKQKGEIRQDIPVDTTAAMFTHLKDGYDAGKSGVSMDFSIFSEQFNFFYSLLK